MDKELLKAIILELRGDNERSFQEISDIIEHKYGIRRSRQAICGMYNRAISDKAICKNTDKIIATNDILHYYAIGVSVSRILEILKADEIDITLNDIKKIIDSNGHKLKIIKETMEDKVYRLLNNKEFTYEEIKIALSYKIESPKASALNELVKKATLRVLNEQKIKVLSGIMGLVQDERLMRSIVQSENESVIKFRDIAKAATST